MKYSYKILELKEPSLAVSLEEVKGYLRVTHDYDDTLLINLARSATELAENFLRCSISYRKIQLTVELIGALSVNLAFGPVHLVETVRYSYKGQIKELDSSEYYLNAQKISFNHEIFAAQANIIYMAGYEKTDKIPNSIKSGIMLHTAYMYDNSGSTAKIPQESMYLYKPFRVIKI